MLLTGFSIRQIRCHKLLFFVRSEAYIPDFCTLQIVARRSFELWERTTLRRDATNFLPEGILRFAAYISANCFTKYCHVTLVIILHIL